MVGSHYLSVLSVLRTRSRRAEKKTVIVGLKSDNWSREMLLRVLTSDIKSGDTVLAIHVQEPNGDTFDPNTFHIHEDVCKSKQVDFLVKVCIAESYISELCNQARVNYATILVLGCRTSEPKDSVIASCIKGLPFCCTLLVVDIGGKALIRKQGTSQQGSITSSYLDQSGTPHQLEDSFTISTSSASSSMHRADNMAPISIWKTVQVPETMADELFQRLAFPEPKGMIRSFTSVELSHATSNFSPEMVIGEGGHGKVYQAILQDVLPAAVKVLKATNFVEEDLFREIEMLTNIEHDNIVQVVGYCNGKEMKAIIYNLLRGSLKQKLRELRWSERMGVAIGVAKALEHLHHHCNPPIIHRDVKSSNILLNENFQPQLSDFGAATTQHHSKQTSAKTKPFSVVGTFGYLAPEYVMYGTVNEKIDVYSYGVVLLELITGKEAIQTNQDNCESLVLWARPLLSGGEWESLIDSSLNNDYNTEEMEMMMIAARLCLMDSASRRPTMKVILKLFEEPENWLRTQTERWMASHTHSSQT